MLSSRTSTGRVGVGLAAGLFFIASGLAACSTSTPDTTNSVSAPETPGSQTAGSSTLGTSAASDAVAPSSMAIPPDDAGSTSTSSTTEPSVELPSAIPAPTLDPIAPEETGVAPRVEANDNEGQLTAVTAATGEGADTLTFTFAEGDIPGYDIRYVDSLVRGVDDVVLLDGAAVMSVTFTRSTPGADGAIADAVSTNESYDLPVIKQVLLSTNLGGTVTFGVGTAEQAPFTVAVDGQSLIVSFQHAQG